MQYISFVSFYAYGSFNFIDLITVGNNKGLFYFKGLQSFIQWSLPVGVFF